MTTDAKRELEIPRALTVRELATLVEETPVQMVKLLMSSGVMADVNKTIDYETAAIIAVDLGFDPQEAGEAPAEAKAPPPDEKLPAATDADDPSTLQPRPPVVALLGHVDHGKTSLLDAIREANVVATEAGGITQHIGAYQATVNDRLLTFLDTPGHEAFTQMRSRGAEATDIAVLVIAADDGVMPQTREAANHIRAAGVPLIVALNKIDLEAANLDRIKTQLTEAEIVIEEYGGDVPFAPVSAVTKEGLDGLLETILLVADLQNLQANPDRPADGVVLESGLDRRQGPRTTLLIKRGTLRVGDPLLVGEAWGRIRAMFDFSGGPLKEATPSVPVAVLGIQGVAAAGQPFHVVESDRAARRLYERAKRQREDEQAKLERAVSLDTLFGEISRGDVQELNLVLKADVDGSIEPLRQSLEQLTNEEVHVKVIHAAAGAVSESDVTLALAARGMALAFNVGTEPGAQKLAAAEGVEIRRYDVIYELIEQIEAAISGMLEPVNVDVVNAHAEVLQVFSIRRIGNVAGARCDDGTIDSGLSLRVHRGGEEIASGQIRSLRRFQADAREVQAGQEFGVALTGFDDFQTGDQLEFFHTERQSRILKDGRVQVVPSQSA